MQCAQHPDRTAVYYCSHCGKALCDECTNKIDSRILCSDCLPSVEASLAAETAATPPEGAGRTDPLAVPPLAPAMEKGDPYCSPGLAFVLGLMPGVGAICNGELVKAFIHVLIFGSLVSLSGSDQVGGLNPLFGIMVAAFYFYMPLEAYHTAKKRVMALRGVTIVTPFERMQFSSLWVGILAILAGALFLANQFVPNTIAYVLRGGWPVIVILIGVYNLARYFGVWPRKS